MDLDAAVDPPEGVSDDRTVRASRRSRLDDWINAPTVSWSIRIEAVRSSRYAWPVLYGAVFAGQAMMLLLAGRNQWYFFDEWRLIVERVADPGDVSLFERLFRPDGEHVIAVPLAVFILLANLGGLDSYGPFVIANVVVRLATLWVADDIVRRLGGRRTARLMVLVSIAFFGEGNESLFGQSLIFAGLTLVFSLLALREAIRVDVSLVRATSVATLLLIAAVFSTSYAFPVVLAVALVLALTRGLGSGLVALVVPPVAFLAVRALAGGSYSEQQAISPRFVGVYVDYVQVGLTSLGEAVTGLVGLGLASFVALVAVSVVVSTERRAFVLVAALTLAVVAFFGQASLSRSALGAGQAASTRYLFFCGVLVFVMLGSAWASRCVGPRVAAVIALCFAVSVSNNVGRLVDGYEFFIPKMELSEERLAVGFAVQEEVPQFVPDPDWAPDLRMERLEAVAAWPGSESFVAAGEACVAVLLNELRQSGIELESLTAQQTSSLVVLLNEHSLGYGPIGASVGDLVQFAAAGGTGSTVLDQFSSAYVELAAPAGGIHSVPSVESCR